MKEPGKFASWLAQKPHCVLGGGGIKGLSHCGFAQALEERNIEVNGYDCVSIGTLIGTFLANGYRSTELSEIFLTELDRFGKDVFAKAMGNCRNPLQVMRQGGLVDVRPLFTSMVERYKLRPQPHLRIIAATREGMFTFRPYVFEGVDYDLVTAMHASCAMPMFLQSAFIIEGARKTRLVDGGLFHQAPHHFCNRSAIISRLGLASRLPKQNLTLVDWTIHLSEMCVQPFKEWRTEHPGPEHLVIPTGDPSVATFTFNLTEASCRAMVQHGYMQTKAVLDALLKDD